MHQVNRNFPPDRAVTVPYAPWAGWSGDARRGFPHGTCYHGMSPKALHDLGRAYGYVLVHVMTEGVNAVLLRRWPLAPRPAPRRAARGRADVRGAQRLAGARDGEGVAMGGATPALACAEHH